MACRAGRLASVRSRATAPLSLMGTRRRSHFLLGSGRRTSEVRGGWSSESKTGAQRARSSVLIAKARRKTAEVQARRAVANDERSGPRAGLLITEVRDLGPVPGVGTSPRTADSPTCRTRTRRLPARHFGAGEQQEDRRGSVWCGRAGGAARSRTSQEAPDRARRRPARYPRGMPQRPTSSTSSPPADSTARASTAVAHRLVAKAGRARHQRHVPVARPTERARVSSSARSAGSASAEGP